MSGDARCAHPIDETQPVFIVVFILLCPYDTSTPTDFDRTGACSAPVTVAGLVCGTATCITRGAVPCGDACHPIGYQRHERYERH